MSKGYAAQAGLSPVQACLQVLGETEKVLKLILAEEEPEIRTAENAL